MCYSPCTWFLHIQHEKNQHFEYDACRTRCLNQIYEDTNLHLLSVWRGFPCRNKGLGFPKPQLEVLSYKLFEQTEKFLFKASLQKTLTTAHRLNRSCFGKPGFVLNSFSAHYATLLCFLYWLLLLSPSVCLCREEQTSTVSAAEGDLGLLFTLSVTMYSSSSSPPAVSTWSTVLPPHDLFEKDKNKKTGQQKKKHTKLFIS